VFSTSLEISFLFFPNRIYKYVCFFPHTHTVHLDIIEVFLFTNWCTSDCLKNDFKIYIKIDIKTAPTCFGAVLMSILM
jgi:hypothetical protein